MTRPTVIFESQLIAGAVVIVPFPYSDRLAEKRRPALVISTPQVHSAGYCWLAMITTASHAQIFGDVGIENLEVAGLPAPSIVRLIKVACIEPQRIVRIAGHLSENDWLRTRGRLRDMIAT